MQHTRSLFLIFALALFHLASGGSLSVAGLSGATHAQLSRAQQAPGVPDSLKEVGISEHLGEKVSIQTLKFKDESGQERMLGEFFHRGRPVILNLVYYECPSLCSLVLNGFVKSLKALEWTPGKEFDIVTVSIDPKESPALAAAKKSSIITSYGRPEASQGWHFLTGNEPEIKQLAREVGFNYKYVPEEKQYAHSAAIFALTPEGKISRYLYGIDFPKREMKFALIEASNGKVGTMVERFLLFCYRYDSANHKYSVYVSKVMQAGTAGTLVIFGGYLTVFWNRQRRLVSAMASEKNSTEKKES